MASEADLLSLWDKIEDGAVGLYRQQIESTIKAFGLSPEKFWVGSDSSEWDVEVVSSKSILGQDISRHVKWFNWDNIQHLVAAIKASGSVSTLKGKVFEFMFALELCSLSNSSILWTRLTSDMDLEPRLDWNPSISIVDKVDDCVDDNVVYVMKDPDYRKLKTDVVFFAQSNSTPVRVLCQLTVQKSDSTTKANEEALQEMLKIPPLSGTNDCRIFLAPESSIRVTQTYKANYNDNNCYFIDRDSFATMMHLPLDLYNPSQTAESLKMLMDIAKDQDDVESAQNIAIFLSGSSLKRQRNKFGGYGRVL
ncbi:hypothetical protein MP228_002007 [Amoeboaphelidium protococcarum]|nr:hypothetical protein MP228_002007 [Amoeboaphelidium protococcarum]